MAREKVNTGGAAVLDDEATSGEQGNMFPDLDKSKPAEKELISRARRWIKLADARKEALDEAKEKEDEAHDAIVEQAKLVKIEKFSVDNTDVTIEHTDKAKRKTSKTVKTVKDENSKDDGDE